MTPTLNRRNWLKANAFAAAGLAIAPVAPVSLPKKIRTGGDIRLHSNENPAGPSAAARHAITEAFDLGGLYPGEQYKKLETMIAEKEGLTPDHIVLGAGSHEVLRMAGTAYGIDGGEVLTAYPTYEGMERYAKQVGAFVHRVPLDDDLQISLENMDRRTTQSVKLVFVCNPNNPTGGLLPGKEMQTFCEEVSRRAVVFVDEAYHEYVNSPSYHSMIDLVKRGENVIVSRTFSKIFGLAGLRVGYGITRPDIAQRLRAFRTGSSVNVLAVHAAMASYGDEDYVSASQSMNSKGRSFVTDALQEVGHRVLHSQTNFIFFHLGSDIRAFGDSMREKGIRVGRPFPPYMDWCRLSIGTPEEMEQFTLAFGSL